MKKIILFLLPVLLIYSFKPIDKPKYIINHIVLDGKRTVLNFNIINENLKITPDKKLEYFWYGNAHLNSNFGGYSGYLLHGSFKEFDETGHLLSDGNYSFGLKDGNWRYWDKTGKLTGEEQWRKGWLKKKYLYENTTVIVEKYKKNKLNGKRITLDNNKMKKAEKYKNGIMLNEKTPSK